MLLFPPFIQYWSNNKKFKFYIHNPIKLELANEQFKKVDSIDNQTPALSITPEDDAIVVSVQNTDKKINLAGSKRNFLKVTDSIFFKFMNFEFFLDNVQAKDSPVFSTTGIVCDSLLSRSIVDTALSYARTDFPIFIVGATGTGKELLAKNLHYNSIRKLERCNVLDCSSFKPLVAERELFGNVKGAYTNAVDKSLGIFMNTMNGTLILDEIANIPLSSQSMLLRCIENNEIKQIGSDKVLKHNVRIILLSNIMPEDLMKQGLLREDFYYRIERYLVRLPFLSARKEDIAKLAKYFAGDLKISCEAIDYLCDYHWPGNIRELKFVIEKALMLSRGTKIEKKHIILKK